MALSLEGATAKVEPQDVIIAVSALHPLVKLANLIPWPELIALCMEDLKRTTAKGCWWTGRKLYVRIHLAVCILQKLFNKTDRQIEKDVKDNAAYQLFCGATLIAKWHCPDHTKIEEFRSRLSPETQRQIANGICKCAVSLGFADPSAADIDSTVQEANIAYPSDASLMTKLAAMGKKVIDYLSKKTRGVLPEGLVVDMKAVKGKAREYFFMPKNADIEKRRSVFKELLQLVKQQIRPVVEACAELDSKRLARMPWNIRRVVEQINSQAWRYLLDVAHFTRTHTIKPGKVLSFHTAAVACIKKGKAGKDKEFGRIFQLGRIKGNFFFVGAASASLKTNDKQEFVPMLDEHAELFGEGTLKSASADKGYWSAKNLSAA